LEDLKYKELDKQDLLNKVRLAPSGNGTIGDFRNNTFDPHFNANYQQANGDIKIGGKIIELSWDAAAGFASYKGAISKIYPKDFATKNTKNWSSLYKSEGEARTIARTKIGKNPIEIEPGKWRSADGKWQYRAKPGDVAENHIHIEELDPRTGEVIQNYHLRWPKGESR